jgi:hypothetical protein
MGGHVHGENGWSGRLSVALRISPSRMAVSPMGARKRPHRPRTRLRRNQQVSRTASYSDSGGGMVGIGVGPGVGVGGTTIGIGVGARISPGGESGGGTWASGVIAPVTGSAFSGIRFPFSPQAAEDAISSPSRAAPVTRAAPASKLSPVVQGVNRVPSTNSPSRTRSIRALMSRCATTYETTFAARLSPKADRAAVPAFDT